jgi:hypothetical protein
MWGGPMRATKELCSDSGCPPPITPEHRMKLLKILIASLALAFATTAGAAKLEVSQLKKVSSFVTAGDEAATSFKRVPQKAFTIADRLYFLTMITWEPVGSKAGRHKLTYLWYANGVLVSKVETKVNFYATPFETWGTIPASALGVGEHKVELLIDDWAYDTQTFTVTDAVPAPEQKP